MNEVYHNGERKIQQMVGEELQANSNGRVITDTILKGAINFIEKQPMAIVSSVSRSHEVWTSLLVGDFGFTAVLDQNAIELDRDKIFSDDEDVFFQNLSVGAFIGVLFIELQTRRRFRLNGLVIGLGRKIIIKVVESYPNCPKYIQQRIISSSENYHPVKSEKTFGKVLIDEISIWILESDTFFVGSQGPSGSMDASHRGGNPGFIEILGERTLKIPDYSGNSMYNTLGNMIENPSSGLLFVDFEKRRTLQLTGKSTLLFNQSDPDDLLKTGGTGRFWLFEINQWLITSNHHSVNWEFIGYSPFNPEL